MEKDELRKMLDTNELNRLQRAAKNKDKNEIKKWADVFSEAVNEYYYSYYRKQFEQWVEKASNDIVYDWQVMTAYVLHFNPSTKFGPKRMKSFMDDLRELVKGINTGEFTRKEYEKQLYDDGFKFHMEDK